MRVVNYSANYIGIDKTLQKFAYLWKLDDSEWVETRKAQAKVIATSLNAKGNSAKTIQEYTSYFCKGKLLGYIDEIYKYFMTPIESAEIAKEVFESQLFSKDQRRHLYGAYATFSHKFCPEIPWLEDHVRYFIDGVLGNQYEEIEQEHNGHRYKISPHPPSWCKRYVSSALELFQLQDGYYGCVDCLPYFVSILPYVDDAEFRGETELSLMFDLAISLAMQTDAMPQAHQLAQTLLDRKSEILEAWAINAHLDSQNGT